MKRQAISSGRGMTLIELMIAMGLSLLVLAAAVTLFKNSMDASNNALAVVDMQQSARVAFNVMVRDLSIAATGGFPRLGVNLPSGAGATAVNYACDQTSTCYMTPSSYAVGGLMYAVNVATGAGPNVTGAGNTDGVVTVTVDPTWACNGLSLPAGSPAANGSGMVVPNPNNPDCIATAASPQGATVGDVFMILDGNTAAVAEATAVDDPTQTVTFGGDSTYLNMNQTAAPGGNIPAMAPFGNPAAFRLNVVSYFLRVINGVPVLMRQVNANTPIQVAENIEDMKISYDLWNNAANPAILQTGVTALDPVGPPPQTANMIRKVNIAITARSRQPDPTGQYRRVRLATYVSPRGLSFFDRYN